MCGSAAGCSLSRRVRCRLLPGNRNQTLQAGGGKILSCSLCTGAGLHGARAVLQTGVAAAQTFSPLVKDKIRSAAFSRRTKQVFQVLFNSLLRHLLRGCELKDTDLVLHLWCHRGNGCPFGPSVYFALLFLSPSKHAEGPAKLCKQRAKLHEFLCKVFLNEVRMKEDLKIPDTGSSTLKQTHLLTAHHWEKQKNKQKKTRV